MANIFQKVLNPLPKEQTGHLYSAISAGFVQIKGAVPLFKMQMFHGVSVIDQLLE